MCLLWPFVGFLLHLQDDHLVIDLTGLEADSDDESNVQPATASSCNGQQLPATQSRQALPLYLQGPEDNVHRMLQAFQVLTDTYEEHVPADLEDLWRRISLDRPGKLNNVNCISRLPRDPTRPNAKSRSKSQDP